MTGDVNPTPPARHRPIAVLGAPSAIGIRPYPSGGLQEVARAPRVLREAGLVERLRAEDAGDVAPPAYADVELPPGRVRNPAEVAAYSRTLGARIAAAGRGARFVVLVAGECSVVLGALLGARALAGGPVGLVYLDAHADFATPADTVTGSVAGMGLSFAIGRGGTALAQLGGAAPLVEPAACVLVGRRDPGEDAALRASGIVELDDAALRARGPAATAAAALAHVDRAPLRGFWIHVDLDVIDPRAFPAVEAPEPGGPDLDTMAALLAPLVRHPRALGLHVSIYDPRHDPDGACAARLVELLARALGD